MSNKFPTTPKSAISKIGASASLLMAMMVRAPFGPVTAKRAGLESDEMRRLARERNVGGKLTLEHLPREQQLVAFFAEADGIADERASQRGAELRSEVAHLVGVGHQHQRRLL